jgi:hypothetical protein
LNYFWVDIVVNGKKEGDLLTAVVLLVVTMSSFAPIITYHYENTLPAP